ncbi:MAG: hypothetical protein QXG86_03310, partial [Candidatus Woesearchaeota archaeon]
IDDTKATLTIYDGLNFSYMTYNSTLGLWTYETIASLAGINNWYVNATSTIFSNLSANDTFNITSCANLTNHNGEYYLNNNRTLCYAFYYVNDTNKEGIIIFNNSGLTLDCNNSILYRYNGTESEKESGIVVNNLKNIKIQNCRFSGLNNNIIINNSENITITNIEGTFNYEEGIKIENSKNVIISGYKSNTSLGSPIFINNTNYSLISSCFMSNSSKAEIKIEEGNYINITNINSTLSHDDYAVISLVKVNYARLNNIRIYNSANLFGIALGDITAELFSQPVIYLNNSIANVHIENLSTGQNISNISQQLIENVSISSIFLGQLWGGAGIGSVAELNLLVENVTIKNTSICVVELDSLNTTYKNLQIYLCNIGFGTAFFKKNSEKIVFENSSIRETTFAFASANTTFNSPSSIKNITIYNSSYLKGSENSNISIFNNIRTFNVANGFYIVNSSITLSNSIVNATDSIGELYDSNLTFVNVTYNKDLPVYPNTNSYWGVKWVLNVLVTDTLSNPLSAVNVTARNIFNELIFSSLTNTSGRIPQQNLTYFIYGFSGPTYYENYSINASKENYLLPAPISVRINESKFLTILLYSNQSLIIYSPTNASYYNTNIINLSYVVLFNNTDKCWYYNTTNQKVDLPNCTNTTFYAEEGFRNISVYANSTTGDLTFVNIFFYVDTTYPQITNINVSEVGNTTATIRWTTSEQANGSVNYGTTTDLGNKVSKEVFNTTHIINLSGLSNYKLYYFNVTSCDKAGNCKTEGPNTFTTQRGDYQPRQLHIPEGDIIIQELVASELTATPQRTSLTPGSKYIFTLDSERHEIKLRTVYKDSYAVFEISSSPKNISLKKGENALVDITDDGINDIEVYVVDIFLTKVTIQLKRVSAPKKEEKPSAPPVVEQPTQPSVITPETQPQEKEEEKEAFLDKYGTMLITFALFLLVSVYVATIVLQRKKSLTAKSVEAEKRGEKEETIKISRLEYIMDKVYSMLSQKQTDEDVKKFLEKMNLEDNIIKSIIYEMRTKNNRLDQLIKYIKVQKEKGKSIEDIKKELEKVGWAKNIIKLATEE